MIRPTARLHFLIDPDVANDDLVTDIKRCYLNVAPVIIEEGTRGENTLRLVVVLHEPLWEVGDARSDEVWSDILIPWLEKKLFKLDATVRNFNRTRKAKAQPVYYENLEIALGDELFSLALSGDCAFPDETCRLIDRFRTLKGEGAFGGGAIACVDMPWRETLPALELPEEAPGVAGDEERDGTFPEAGETVEGASSADTAAELPEETAGALEREAKPASEPPIDYTLWEVRFTDGSSAVFNEQTGGAVEVATS